MHTMTLEFKDIGVSLEYLEIGETGSIGGLTEARREGWILDPIWMPTNRPNINDDFMIYHLVKGTPEEIEEYKQKFNPMPKIIPQTTFDVKMACIMFAKDVRQYNPIKDAFLIQSMKDAKAVEGFEWIVTDKWKDLVEWSLLPDEIVKRIRDQLNPKIEFSVAALLKGLTAEQVQEVIRAGALIADPLSQELIRKAAEGQRPQPS